jgi:chemotaxis signal transduction protein
MATLLRSRRFADRASEATQKYVTFAVRQYWFALPIQVLQRVSSCNAGDEATSSEAGLITQDSDEFQRIDLEQTIFPTVVSSQVAFKGLKNPKQASCLILFKSAADHTFGISIDAQPKMQRVTQSQISLLSEAIDDSPYLRSVCSSVIQLDGAAPIFLLDLDKLCHR